MLNWPSNSMKQNPQDANSHWAAWEIPCLLCSFITMFTWAYSSFISWAKWIQSTPYHPLSLSLILILSSYLGLDQLSGFFPLGFLIKILYLYFFVPACYMPRTSYPPCLGHPNNILWIVHIMKLLIMHFPFIISADFKYIFASWLSPYGQKQD
jgi:hypothetical protein